MQTISRQEFNQFDIQRMMPEALAPVAEIQWFKASEHCLATLTMDKFDRDYGYIIMEKNLENQFICVNTDSAMFSRQTALDKLQQQCQTRKMN
ncbi:MAG: hypothetical protein HRU20_17640 [Pseudomonadales bacterium]|nr:hypothetical protein [Pseudomonadales bacterium]